MFPFIQVLRNYFKELEEMSVRDNLVVIYEFLDEMMDKVKILSELLIRGIRSADSANWRPLNLHYKKNEFFLYVIEKVNMLISSTSNVIKRKVIGDLKMKCFLSGMQELKLGLNDKILF